MNTVIKTLVAVFGAGLVASGLAAMLAPMRFAATFAIDEKAIIGLSTLRGMVGGLFIGLGAMLLLGLLRRDAGWLRATALMFGLIAAGRVLGFALDGPTPDSLLPFTVEMFGFGLALVASRRPGLGLTAAEKGGPGNPGLTRPITLA